jgi:hypothetical protein
MFIFNYQIPADDPTVNTDGMEWAGTIKADYWFGGPMVDKNRNIIKLGPNTAPKLSKPKLTPLTGPSSTNFQFSCVYTDTDGPNGQPPAYVRVMVDGNLYDMTPSVNGTPSYISGALYTYSMALPTGAHKYHFEASDGEATTFIGYYGSTPINIVDIPGPWVNDPPVLSDGKTSTTAQLTTLDPVDFLVTYTDKDNDGPFANDPDAAYPWCWIDSSETFNTAHYGVVDELIGEDGTGATKARKLRLTAPLIWMTPMSQ